MIPISFDALGSDIVVVRQGSNTLATLTHEQLNLIGLKVMEKELETLRETVVSLRLDLTTLNTRISKGLVR